MNVLQYDGLLSILLSASSDETSDESAKNDSEAESTDTPEQESNVGDSPMSRYLSRQRRKDQRSTRFTVYIGIAVLLIALSVGAFFLFFNQSADSGPATIEEAVARYEKALTAQDLEALHGVYAEPFATRQREMERLRLELSKLHKELQSVIKQKFREETDVNAAIVGKFQDYVEPIQESPFANQPKLVSPIKIVGREPQSRPVPPLKDRGTQFTFSNPVVLTLEATAILGTETKKSQQPLLAVKQDGKWRLIEVFWVMGASDPIESMREEVDAREKLADAFRSAIHEVREDQYKSRWEVAQVMAWACEDTIADHEPRVLSVPPEEFEEQLELSISHDTVKVADVMRFGNALGKAEVTPSKLAEELRTIKKGEGERCPILHIRIAMDVDDHTITAVLGAILDSGYDYRRTMIGGPEDVLPRLKNLTSEGRFRLFTRPMPQPRENVDDFDFP